MVGEATLQALYGSTYNGEPLVGEVFYNHSGGWAQDFAETFIQRAQEIDSSGELGKRFEFLWETITDGDRSFWDRLTASIAAVGPTLDALYQDVISKVVAGWSLLLSNPPTESDYTNHNARLEELASQGQKLLLVAHSQGNLFVNHAYDHISPKAAAGSVGVSHIAPASPTLRGGYVLSVSDLIIDLLLRVEGIGSVPAPNISITPSRVDPTGHYLIETYLDGSRSGRAAVKNLMDRAIGALVTPSTTGTAGIGFFTVTLTWNGSGDVDLHTFEPNGVHVYYQNKTGISGFLDIDNTVANGPEHYYATCDPRNLQLGTYSIGINNYARATGRTATVQAASLDSGTLLTRSLDVGAERGSGGNDTPIPVFTITVSRDSNGVYTVSAR